MPYIPPDQSITPAPAPESRNLFNTLLSRAKQNPNPGAFPPPSMANGLWTKPPQGGPMPPISQPPTTQSIQPRPPQGENPRGPEDENPGSFGMISPISGLPTAPPSESKLPPAWKRWDNAQHLEKAYQNDWKPNPMLLRAMMGRG